MDQSVSKLGCHDDHTHIHTHSVLEPHELEVPGEQVRRAFGSHLILPVVEGSALTLTQV